MTSTAGPSKAHRGALPWAVHIGLIASTVTSLVLEPVLARHVVFGLEFVVLVGCHLVQRRRVSTPLATRLLKLQNPLSPAGHLVFADGFLLIISWAMFISGFRDLWAPHRTKIRWHAITGVVLTIFLVVHTMRHWRWLRFSQIRRTESSDHLDESMQMFAPAARIGGSSGSSGVSHSSPVISPRWSRRL